MLETYRLSWMKDESSDDFENLLDLLRRRIWAYNIVGRQTLTEISVPSLRNWIEEAMVEEAAGSPRNLLKLGSRIFFEHCQYDPTPESMITMEDWERAVNWFRIHNPGQSQLQGHSNRSSSNASSESLIVDVQAGKVFRGKIEIESSLSEKEFRLLAYLYRRKQQICQTEEIVEAVYGSDARFKPQMLTSLVYRLRNKMQTMGFPEDTIQSFRGRGYCLNSTD